MDRRLVINARAIHGVRKITGKNRAQAPRGGEPLVDLTAYAQIHLHVILAVQETVNNLGGEWNKILRYRRYPVVRPVVPGLELLATRQVTSYKGRRRQGHLSAEAIDIAVAAADCRQCVINHAYTLRFRRIIKIADEVGSRIVVERPAAPSTHAYMFLLIEWKLPRLPCLVQSLSVHLDIAAELWGELVGQAQLRGRPRRQNHTWIAACCLRYRLPLVALNTAEFDDFAEYHGLMLLGGQTLVQPRGGRRAAAVVGVEARAGAGAGNQARSGSIRT
jgi:hypothetical protein